MRSILLSLSSIILVTGCSIAPLSSNVQDGGVCAQPNMAQGQGSITGPQSFTARASYESAQHLLDADGGVISTLLTISLYENGITCASLANGVADAGRIVGFELSTPQPAITPGTYATQYTADGGTQPSDGGLRTLALVQNGEAPWKSQPGNVTIISVAACSVTGTFDFTLGLADGGTSPLKGTFSSVYCPH